MELLLAAGYFRVRIKGLSDFEKVTRFSADRQLPSSRAGRRWTGVEYSGVQLRRRYRRALRRECQSWSEDVNSQCVNIALIFFLRLP